MKDVASVHSTLWPEEPQNNQILNIGILTGQVNLWDAKTGIIETGIIIIGPSARASLILGDLGRQRRSLIADKPITRSLLHGGAFLRGSKKGIVPAWRYCPNPPQVGLSLHTAPHHRSSFSLAAKRPVVSWIVRLGILGRAGCLETSPPEFAGKVLGVG